MAQKTQNRLDNKKTGSLGEQLAAFYLQNQGFTILEMNYLKKWGEIDVIAKKNNKVHFVEVKTVSYETKQFLEKAVAHGTWRPEENVHASKLQKLARAIESWLQEHSWDGEWQIDVAALRIVPRETFCSIKYLDNIIFD